jgi:hypothetical protein
MGDPQVNYNNLAMRVTKVEKNVENIDRTLVTLAGRTTDVATAIARIETTIGSNRELLKYACIIAFLWLGALTYYGIGLIKDVGTLQGKGGSYQATEQALQDSKTPEQASANLALLVAQVQKRAAVGKPLDQAQLDSVAVTVRGATKSFPGLPRAWDAAATVINTRFSVNTSGVPENLPDCLDTIVPGQERDRFTHPDGTKTDSPGFIDAPSQIPWRAHAVVQNCVLDLDATPKFANSSVGKFFANEKMHHPNTVALFIEATHAKIIYSGGPMLPVSEIHFVNCIFDLHPTLELPPSKGRKFASHLLTADLDDNTINLGG